MRNSLGRPLLMQGNTWGGEDGEVRVKEYDVGVEGLI